MSEPANVIRALDVLRIALGLETSAERKVRIDNEIATIKFSKHPYGMTLTLPNGRRAVLFESAFLE